MQTIAFAQAGQCSLVLIHVSLAWFYNRAGPWTLATGPLVALFIQSKI